MLREEKRKREKTSGKLITDLDTIKKLYERDK